MHGHSRKPDVFMYGCENPKDWESSRLLPFILDRVSPIFDYKSSDFSV